ncbi:hypothetical protein Nepgr_011859 [Nepenthes gracilis]|uniref:Protein DETOXIFICATION n=1 Tax=Nepenthes gracilis TaxID=150966 RepID=A0AAD3XMA2_NEPGR|nr:hypothetical protein Nepgr_011859 [Nepenthes gracilis]
MPLIVKCSSQLSNFIFCSHFPKHLLHLLLLGFSISRYQGVLCCLFSVFFSLLITVMSPGIESGVLLDSEEGRILSNDGFIHGFLRRLPLKEVAEELRLLGKIAWPVVITTLLLHSKSIVSMLFLGHLGNSELAGGSLAISFANVTGFSVIKGLSMGMEPICCQAYGAKRWSVLTQTFQRTLCLLLLAAIPISVLWLNMEPLLLLLGQDPDITQLAKLYLQFSIPELMAQVHFQPLRVFLRAQCITKPLSFVSAFGLILHLPINYFLVIHLGLGVKGVALASACITMNLNLALLLYLVVSKTILKPWDEMTILSLSKGWKPVLALAMPSVVAVCLEWWWYEIMLFLCGLLHNPFATMAAMGILIQMAGLLYVFPHALSLGLSTRIGHELGAGQASRARRTTVIGLAVAVALGMTAFGFTTLARYAWGKMYTSEPETLTLVSIALPILGFCEVGNCPQTAACGVLRGSARPKTGAQINFIAFYIIGLPVAIIMAFVFKIGFLGLCFGLIAAQASCMCMMVYELVQTDWKHQVKRAAELTRVADETDHLKTSLLS